LIPFPSSPPPKKKKSFSPSTRKEGARNEGGCDRSMASPSPSASLVADLLSEGEVPEDEDYQGDDVRSMFRVADRAVSELYVLTAGAHDDDTENLARKQGRMSVAETSASEAEGSAPSPSSSFDDGTNGQQPSWIFVGEKMGIKLYRKETPGIEMQVLKGVGTLPFAVEEFSEVLAEMEEYAGPAWDPLFEGGQIVEKIDRFVFVFFLPQPLRLCAEIAFLPASLTRFSFLFI
jgi:hypothetical protein